MIEKEEANYKNYNVIEFTKDNEPAKILSKNLKEYINFIHKTRGEKKTTVKEVIAGSIGCDTRAIDNWTSASGTDVKISNAVKLAKLMKVSTDFLLTGKEFYADKHFLDSTGLANNSAEAIDDLNRHIIWNNEFKTAQERLQLNSTTTEMMEKGYSHKGRKKQNWLWDLKVKDPITVTFSQLLNFCVPKHDGMITILDKLSDVLNSLEDWNLLEDRSKFIKELMDKYQEDDDLKNKDSHIEKTYQHLRDGIKDDAKLKDYLDNVPSEISEIVENIVRSFIIETFFTLDSEKNSNS